MVSGAEGNKDSADSPKGAKKLSNSVSEDTVHCEPVQPLCNAEGTLPSLDAATNEKSSKPDWRARQSREREAKAAANTSAVSSVEAPIIKRKRGKTRSRQKNLRRDKRPPSSRPAHLNEETLMKRLPRHDKSVGEE